MSKVATPSPRSGGRRPHTYLIAPPGAQIPIETGKFTASGRGKKEGGGDHPEKYID